MGDKVTLSQRRFRQWHHLKMGLEGRMTLREVSERKGVSYRHAKRLEHVVARDGPGWLIHGNTGRRPTNSNALELKKEIVQLSGTECALRPVLPRRTAIFAGLFSPETCFEFLG